MSAQTIVTFLLNTGLIAVGVYAILHEDELIRFERKAKKYVKAFFMAAYYTVKERAGK